MLILSVSNKIKDCATLINRNILNYIGEITLLNEAEFVKATSGVKRIQKHIDKGKQRNPYSNISEILEKYNLYSSQYDIAEIQPASVFRVNEKYCSFDYVPFSLQVKKQRIVRSNGKSSRETYYETVFSGVLRFYRKDFDIDFQKVEDFNKMNKYVNIISFSKSKRGTYLLTNETFKSPYVYGFLSKKFLCKYSKNLITEVMKMLEISENIFNYFKKEN